jgi:hypothetical protein
MGKFGLTLCCALLLCAFDLALAIPTFQAYTAFNGMRSLGLRRVSKSSLSMCAESVHEAVPSKAFALYDPCAVCTSMIETAMVRLACELV